MIVGTKEPVEGVVITIKKHRSLSNSGSLISGVDGSFLFEDVEAGSYEVSVGNVPSFMGIDPIPYEVEGDKITPIEIVLTPNGSIIGIVSMEGSDIPVPSAFIELSGGPLFGSVRTALTGSTGQYSFENLSNGTYTLEVTHPHYISLKVTYKINQGKRIDGDVVMKRL